MQYIFIEKAKKSSKIYEKIQKGFDESIVVTKKNINLVFC